MTVKQFVDEILCVPVTRIGNKFIIEAIEIVLDSREHKFYEALSEVTHKRRSILETAIRAAKVNGYRGMSVENRVDVFGESARYGSEFPSNTEYIIKAADYYRRKYEDKKG